MKKSDRALLGKRREYTRNESFLEGDNGEFLFIDGLKNFGLARGISYSV